MTEQFSERILSECFRSEYIVSASYCCCLLLQMIFVIGASSIHHFPYSKNCAKAEHVQLADQLRQYAISKPGVRLHPHAANQNRTAQRLPDLGAQDH